MKKILSTIIIFILLSSGPSYGFENYVVPTKKVTITDESIIFPMKVKKGDTLSTLSEKLYNGKIYGKRGTLKKMQILNKTTVKKIDRIYPHQKILIYQDPIATPQLVAVPSPSPNPEAVFSQPMPASVKEVKEVSSAGFFKVELIPEAVFSRIDATDTATHGTSTLLSRLYPELYLGMDQQWSPSFMTHSGIKISDYLQDDPYPKTITPHNQILSEAEVGARKSWGNFHLGLDLGIEEVPVIQATSVTSLNFQNNPAGKSSFYVGANLLEFNKLKLSADVGYGYLFPANFNTYTLNLSPFYYGRVQVYRDYGNFRLLSGIDYRVNDYNLNIVQEHRQDLGFQFGLIWNFK